MQFVVLIVVALALGACDARTIITQDATVPDGGPPDAFIADGGLDAFTPPPDTGPPRQAYLGPCASTDDCEAGLQCARDFPRPFCTRACATHGVCGSGALCVDDRCVPICRSGARQCDAIGGSCTVSEASFCAPACGATGSATSTCPAGWACDSHRGSCVFRVTSTGADIGQPCLGHADCRTGICFSEVEDGVPLGWLGGYCVGGTRSPGPTSDVERGGCPVGSVMMPGNPVGDTTLCMRECRRQADCRSGYYCGAPSGASVGYCLPIDCDIPGVPACPTGSTCQLVPGGARRCVTCRPDCAGRSCGPDGCGGTCGSCGGTATCTPAGTCECLPQSDGELCAAASTACGSIEAVDRCGGARTPLCGSCTPPFTCGEITPGQCGCTPEPVEELCAARGATCGTVRVTDRCGATRDVSCGTCALPETCGGTGVPNTCGVCTPSCGARACGNDGCGGSCGTCGTGMRCTTSGQCEPIPCDPVTNTLCTGGERCEWMTSGNVCIPAGPGRSGNSCEFGVECAAEHTCTSEGFCREYCTSDSHCQSGARCTHNLVGSTYGLCSRPCDPIAGTGCRGGADRCRLLNGARATEVTDCGLTGSGLIGSACSSSTQCLSGYTCVGGSCRRICRLGTSCTGGMCAMVSGWFTYGICP